MARRNAAAAKAAALLLLQICKSFICEKYMKEAGYDAKRCPTCDSPRTCKNHFCLQCEIGGLCPVVFRGDNEHRDHPWLQVRQCSRKDSVLLKDLARFISNEGLKHIHTYKLNEKERHCYLKSKQVAGPSSSSSRTPARVGGDKICAGCMATLHGSENSTEPFLVCSLQCLSKVAEKQPALNLLAMNDGAMNPMPPPPFYSETLSASHHRTTKTPTKSRRKPKTPTKSRRKRKTPTKSTPVDEAPQSPPATGDSPLLETHETPREDPVVEAPPLPPATGDFPMFETLKDVESEAILAALPFPLEIDNYPMFGTPAEASFGEALPFPPATEDSPMSEKPEAPPAAPVGTIKLNTFSLPPKFRALDFGPEWAEKMWTMD